ncbi:Retrovirus-related Pol polyprotein from transposon [Dictyocoela muelleri]|nr:Retrovirus-related Pol polyprotein from transposon [Dictyocoela muelleri]
MYQKQGIVALYSHKLTDTEKRYSIVEKEFYAIYKTFIRFNTILFNSNVHIHTDNKNITFHIKDPSSRIHRWKEFLNRYNITISYIEGSKNIVADTLSRITTISAIEDNTNSEILKWHDEMGHPGIFRTWKSFQYIKPKYTYNKIKNVIKSCIVCQKNTHSKIHYGKIDGILISNKPFDILSTDIIGPFKNYEYQRNPRNEHFSILTITDIFSRITELYILSDITSKSLITNFNKFFKKYQPPSKILSDNGRQYVSREFKSFLYNVKNLTFDHYTIQLAL